MMESEKKIFDKFEQKTTVSKFWMPTVWASNLVNRARLEGRIQSDQMLQTIITELSDFRRRLGRVMIYDTVSVPLVYTQVNPAPLLSQILIFILKLGNFHKMQ